ncbi:MAG: glycosyltransferase family 4 protein [Sphingobacteriales bacterium]|nr:glycosyltransferase family 4 protein [Sphingobacteriales bacterium]
MRKVVFLQKISGIAGAEKYYFEIIPELRKQGWDVSFLGITLLQEREQTAAFYQELQQRNIPYHIIDTPNTLNWGLLKNIRRHLEAVQPDIIHCNLIHSELWVYLVNRLWRQKAKIITMAHGFDMEYTNRYGYKAVRQWGSVYQNITRLCHRTFDGVIYVSDALQQLHEQLGMTARYGKRIYLGFDFPEVQVPPKQHQICCVARLLLLKGHRYLLRAFVQVLERFPKLRLKIIGEGKERAQLEQMCVALGIAQQVDFLGFRQDVLQQVAASQAKVLCSVSEGLGVVLLEALHVKTPVIIFDVPACNEIIQHGYNGFLVPFADETQLAQRIIQVLEQPQLAQQFGDNGIEVLRTRFSKETMLRETIAFYETILKSA